MLISAAPQRKFKIINRNIYYNKKEIWIARVDPKDEVQVSWGKQQ